MDIPFGQGALVDLGESITNLGVAIAGASQKQQHVQVYQDAAATTEYLKARDYYDSQVNSFMNDIQSSSDYQTYDQKWNDLKPTLVNDTTALVTLPKAQDMLNQYLAGALDKTQQEVYQLKRKALVGDSEGTVTTYLTKAAQNGDVGAVQDAIDKSYPLIFPDKAKAEQQWVPLAKYNKAWAMLMTVSQKDRMDILNSPKAAATLDLTTEQVKSMTEAFDSRQKMIDAAAKREVDISNGKLVLKMSDLALKYIEGGISATGYDNFDALIADVGNQNWQGENAGNLQYQWAKVFQDANTPATKDDPAKVAQLWDIALNIDKNKVFTINGKDYGNVTSPAAKASALYATGLLNNGVTGSTFNTIVQATNDFERNPSWKPFIQGVDDHFNPVMAAYVQSKDTKNIQKTAYEKQLAYTSLLDYMRANPNRPDLWQTKLDALMVNNTAKDLNDRATKALTPPGEPAPKFASTWDNILSTITFGKLGKGGPVLSDSMKLEFGRQMFPEAFSQDPSVYPQWRTALPQIQRDLAGFLPRAARDATPEIRSDNSTYFTKGKDIYTVRAASVDGINQFVAWKAIYDDTGKFIRWEQAK